MLRLGTYNLHLGGGAEHWTRLIRTLELDITFAQETVSPQVPADFRTIWYPVPGQSWGSAVVTRLPMESEVRLSSFPGWVVGGIIDIAAGSIAAFSVHNPTVKGRTYAALLHEILDEIAQLKLGMPVVIGGDFNLVSAGKRQPHEVIQPTRQETKLMQRIEQEFGLIGAWGSCRPDAELPQTLRWNRNRAAPYHCDVVLVPESWADRLIACEVIAGADWDQLSDHNPVVVTATLNVPGVREISAV